MTKAELQQQYEAELARLDQEEAKKKEIENKIIDEYPQPIPAVEEARDLTASSQNISDSGVNNNPQFPSSTMIPNRSWESVKTGYLQSFLSVKFQIFFFYVLFLGLMTYLALRRENDTLVMFFIGNMSIAVAGYTGLRLAESNKDKDIEAKKEIEKIKITPLNGDIVNSITSELKKVLPIQGLG